MIALRIPSLDARRAHQSREHAFYWSGAADSLLRRHGIINVSYTNSGDLTVITRGQDVAATNAPCFIEGQLTDATAATFDIKTTAHHADALTLQDADGKPIGTLEYPTCRVRKIPLKAKEISDPYPYVHEDVRWNNRTIRYQCFTQIPEGWEVVMRIEHEGNSVPAVIRRGTQILTSIPLLDICVAGYAFAPLNAGYYDMISNSPVTAIESAVVALIRSIAPRIVEVEWWPHGKRAAFTVRHDLDRPITDRTMKRLLTFYKKHGVKASFAVLQNKLARWQINAIKQHSHELNLHSISRNLEQLVEEKQSLEALIGQRLSGFNSHGGGGSEGFLGDNHYAWGSDAGFSYLEMGGRSTRQPHHLLRIIDDVPTRMTQTVPAVHVSLDAGMKPEAHYLEYIRDLLPITLAQREHFVLMNHPDIHLEQLYTLIETMALGQYWCASFADVTHWYSVTRGAQVVGNQVQFTQPLPEDCTIHYRQSGTETKIQAVKGSVSLVLEKP